MRSTVARILGALVLLAAGLLSLPTAAALLGTRDTENWIVPAQLAAMAALGAVVALVVPGLARAGASRRRRALTGAWLGLLAAFLGVVLFWLLISGLRGA